MNFYVSLEKGKKNAISLQQCDRCSQKFRTLMQNMSPKYRTAKICISKIQGGGEPPWKSKNPDISWWWRTGLSSVSYSSAILNQPVHLRDHILHNCANFLRSVTSLQRYRNFSQSILILLKCKKSLNVHAWYDITLS